MKSMTIPQVEQHVTILGWLYIVSNVVLLLVGGFILLLLTTIGAVSGDAEAMAILSIVGFGVGALSAMLSIPGLVAGAGLLAHKAWAADPGHRRRHPQLDELPYWHPHRCLRPVRAVAGCGSRLLLGIQTGIAREWPAQCAL